MTLRAVSLRIATRCCASQRNATQRTESDPQPIRQLADNLDMGRPKHTLPPVHRTDALRPRWFFRAQVDVQIEPGQFQRREKPYYLGFCDELGKRKAERERDEICARLNNRIEVIQSQTLFAAILDAFEAHYLPSLEPNTQTSYASQIRCHIRPAFEARRLCDVGPLEIQRWINSLPGGKTVAVSVLRSVFERAADWGYTTARNPVKAVRLPERLPVQQRRAYTSGEYLRIRARLRPPIDVAADVAVFCGLRIGEIAALTRASLDYAAGTITVAANMAYGGEISTPKSGKRRTVAMGFLRVDLLHWCRLGAPPEQSVFQLSYQAFAGVLDRALADAGLNFPGAGWHCFRRMYATMGRRHLEMADVQEQMGHARPAMTERYIDDAPQVRREQAMDRMRAEVFFVGEGGRA